jgi:hypothetical protein
MWVLGVGGWKAGAVVVLFGEWEGEQSSDGTSGDLRPIWRVACVLSSLSTYCLSFHPGLVERDDASATGPFLSRLLQRSLAAVRVMLEMRAQDLLLPGSWCLCLCLNA